MIFRPINCHGFTDLSAVSGLVVVVVVVGGGSWIGERKRHLISSYKTKLISHITNLVVYRPINCHWFTDLSAVTGMVVVGGVLDRGEKATPYQ